MDIEYKKLLANDFEFVSELIEKNLGDVIRKSFKGYFNKALFFDRALNIGKSYMVYKNESPCGFFWYSSRGNSLHINTIVIDKEYQGKGIGTYIIDGIEKLARSKGYEYLELGVQGSNKYAYGFYIKKGFEEFGYTKDFDTYYMHKKL